MKLVLRVGKEEEVRGRPAVSSEEEIQMYFVIRQSYFEQGRMVATWGWGTFHITNQTDMFVGYIWYRVTSHFSNLRSC